MYSSEQKRLQQSSIQPKLLTTKFVPIIMFHMLSELPPHSKVGADIVLGHGNVDNFLNLFENV